MSSPAAAGPTTVVTWSAADCRASPAARSSDGISRRSEARRADQSSPWKAAASAVQAKMGHSRGWPSIALTASPADPAASMSWVNSITRRRSQASTTGPPSSDPASSGTSWPRLTSPTTGVEPVSW